jgi:hypothetical protein
MSFSRRKFIARISAAALSLAGLSSFKNKPGKVEMKSIFYHHVFFWLQNAESAADRQKLIDGLHKLSAVKTIKKFHIGKPASTSREVIDSSYSISWLLEFSSDEDQAAYQTDPVHLQFVEDCKHLWKKVLVYDTVDA